MITVVAAVAVAAAAVFDANTTGDLRNITNYNDQFRMR
jgi:hypothetical protein